MGPSLDTTSTTTITTTIANSLVTIPIASGRLLANSALHVLIVSPELGILKY